MENQFSRHFHFKHFPLSSLTRTGRSSLTRTQSLTSSDPHTEPNRTIHTPSEEGPGSDPLISQSRSALDAPWSTHSTHGEFSFSVSHSDPLMKIVRSAHFFGRSPSFLRSTLSSLQFSLRPTQLRPTHFISHERPIQLWSTHFISHSDPHSSNPHSHYFLWFSFFIIIIIIYTFFLGYDYILCIFYFLDNEYWV